MRSLKKKSRLLVLCLSAILLSGGISLASGHVGHHFSGSFHYSGGLFYRGFQPYYSIFPYPLAVYPYYYQYGAYFDTTSRYDNFPYSTGSRYDNFGPFQSQQYTPQLQSNTYNNNNNTYNYTYNYYGSSENSSSQYGAASRSPSPQKSETGIYYENAVNAFKNGDYAAAAENFKNAIRQANKFIPLAYTQALFANGNYPEAVEQLRLALDKYSDSDSILFPSFLYPSNQILRNQIEKLRSQVNENPDLQLLIGYQLFGIKKMDDAAAYLNKAKSNPADQAAATKLLSMMKKAVTTGPVGQK